MPAADRNAARRSVGTTTGGPASSTPETPLMEVWGVDPRRAPSSALGWPATPVGDRSLGYPEACCPEAPRPFRPARPASAEPHDPAAVPPPLDDSRPTRLRGRISTPGPMRARRR